MTSGYYKVIRVVDLPERYSATREMEAFARARALGAELEFRGRDDSLVARYTLDEVKSFCDVERALMYGEKFPNFEFQRDSICAFEPVEQSRPGDFDVFTAPQNPFRPIRLVVDEAPPRTEIRGVYVGQRVLGLSATPVSAEAFKWNSEERPTDYMWPVIQIGQEVRLAVHLIEPGRFAAHLAGTELR